MRIRPLLLLAPLLAVSVFAPAAVAESSGIAVTAAWARASVGTGPAAAYVTVLNKGAKGDRLIGVSSPVSARAELHAHAMQGEVMQMQMQMLDSIEIAPGETLVMSPGGIHIMLLGLSAPLHEGASVALELQFERAGMVSATARVEKLGATGPSTNLP